MIFDKRILFVLVFFITLLSTVCVIIISMLYHQTWLQIALYSLATMWIMGITSQLFIKNLFNSIIRPIEINEQEKIIREQLNKEIDVDQVEKINPLESNIIQELQKGIRSTNKELDRANELKKDIQSNPKSAETALKK